MAVLVCASTSLGFGVPADQLQGHTHLLDRPRLHTTCSSVRSVNMHGG
jgi:hypothetical protein